MAMHRPRLRVTPIVASLAIIALTTIGAGNVLAAPGDCVLRVAVAPGPHDEGGTSLTVEPDVELTLWGSFVPGAQIDLTFTWNGAPYGDFTPGTADAEGDFLFVHSFPASQVGEWTVTAGVEGTECAGTVEIDVVAAGSASSAPAPSPLPDTAAASGAHARSAATTAALTLLAALAFAFGVRAVRAGDSPTTRRRRLRSSSGR